MTQVGGASSIANAKLSILIANYNYEHFLAAAVESALAVDWPSKEVIVVDDGSTDGSRAVLASFGERITAIFKENGGQRAAYNVAFARSAGDIVIFLDSDDVLAPSIMREAASQWTASTVKAQVLMQAIDAQGALLPSVFPQLRKAPTPDEIRLWQHLTGYYPTPPASGNIYARKMLEQIFPLADEGFQWTDTYCISAAPFFGDVVTIAKPLCGYRVHGRNAGAVSVLDADKIRRDLRHALALFEYTQKLGERRGAPLSHGAPWTSLWLLPYRVASYKFGRSEHPIASDNFLRLFLDAMRACLTPQGSGRASIALTVWAVAVMLSPKPLSKHIALWRFSPQSRPRFLHSLLGRLRILRASRVSAGNPAKAPTLEGML
ncbi:MAG: glycosyltransferase family 2 protein [Hyphomonadaceae bacterium]